MSPSSAALSRRGLGLLTFAAVAATAGCSQQDAEPAALPPDPVVDPDREITAAAWSDEDRAVRLLEAVLDRHPGLRGRLQQTLVQHRAHAQVLLPAADADRALAPLPPVAPRPRTALAAVVDVELLLIDAHSRRALRAASGPLARLLAGAAAAAAQQAQLLRTADTR